MPTPTYTPVATVTLASSAATVTFSNIPATYRDLILVVSATGGNYSYFTINGLSTSIYNRVRMQGNGTSTFTSTGNATVGFMADLTTQRTAEVHHFIDYSATDKHKSILSRNNTPDVNTVAQAHRVATTNAITSISIAAEASTFGISSTFNLYGVIA
jgi:hypothetical protein